MPAHPPFDLHSRLRKPVVLSVIAAILIYAVSALLADARTVAETALRLGLAGWGIALGLSLCNYLLRFARWQLYLHQLQARIPPLYSLAYYIGAFALTTTPAKVGETARSVYLARHGVSYSDSLAAFFSERLLDLMAIVLLALAVAYGAPLYRWPALLLALFLVVVVCLVHFPLTRELLGKLLGAGKPGRLGELGKGLVGLLQSAAVLLRTRLALTGLGLGLVAWGAEGLALHVILSQLGADIGLWAAVSIYAVSILVGALSFIPGGLGSTEATMIVLLQQLGVDTPTAIAATIICRLTTLWFAVCLGGGALLWVESRGTDRVDHSA